MMPKTKRLQEYKILQVVSYAIDHVARPLLLFFSSENQLLWFRYQVVVADKPKVQKKRRRAGGASGYDHPPKKLGKDPSTSGDVSFSTGGKSLAAIQELFERSTLNVEVGVSATAIVPFVTSFVTLTLEHEGGDNTDSIFGPNLRTQRPAERFVISSDSFHHSSTNATDVKVTSIVRSPFSPPLVMIKAVATTAVAATTVGGVTSALVLRVGTEPIHASIFTNSTSVGTVGPDIVGPSQHARTELLVDTFYVSQEMDSESPHQIYIPKWNVINNFVLDDPEVARQTCFTAEVRLRFEHNYRERKKFEKKCNRQAHLSKEKDIKIANLKAHLSLKEAEATEAIRLRGQVAIVEATEAVQASQLDSLRERNLALEGEKSALEGQVVALESAVEYKDTKLVNAQVIKLNDDLSDLQLSFDELSTKTTFLESLKDSLTDQILCRGVRLDVMKCLQSLKYVAALGEAIGHATDKAKYVSTVLAFRDLNFNFLSLLESQSVGPLT
uniref:Transposase (Putative), gypsy type n=1 Tax=Tanacetum cinerariifolium TaxID=118510 RepID=A0A699H7G6_TANCI|nr:hypothetical protein [Tanacetum cinerariifolium]